MLCRAVRLPGTSFSQVSAASRLRYHLAVVARIQRKDPCDLVLVAGDREVKRCLAVGILPVLAAAGYQQRVNYAWVPTLSRVVQHCIPIEAAFGAGLEVWLGVEE